MRFAEWDPQQGRMEWTSVREKGGVKRPAPVSLGVVPGAAASSGLSAEHRQEVRPLVATRCAESNGKGDEEMREPEPQQQKRSRKQDDDQRAELAMRIERRVEDVNNQVVNDQVEGEMDVEAVLKEERTSWMPR